MPWWGPVLSPVLISLLMILWGTFATQFGRTHVTAPSNWHVWGLNLFGIALALYIFMADSIAAAYRGLDTIRTVLPERFNWPLFCVALVLMSAPVMQIGRRLLIRRQAEFETDGATGEFSCTRNLEN